MNFRSAMRRGYVTMRRRCSAHQRRANIRRRIKKYQMTQQTQKFLGLLMLIFLLAYAGYLTFRAYLGPDFLIGFANLFVC